MKILIAEDNGVSREILKSTLSKQGHNVVAVEDGLKALTSIQKEIPDMLITDWMMPNLDGLDLCRRVRALNLPSYVYIILWTQLSQLEHVVMGLVIGADDYITKPFERAELLARVRAGERIIQLQKSLRQKKEELSKAQSEVKQLKSLLPICMFCKKIRNDQDYWQSIEDYITEHLEADFTHGICPECMEKKHSEYTKKVKSQKPI